MLETFEVRDHRNKSMFRVDDEYLNGYSKLCGTNATLVYLCLCRHADRHQESFPSVELMSTKLGVSRDSIMRGIKKLIEWNIIQKHRKRRENAQWLNNTYVLLDKSVWKPKPSSYKQHGEAKSQIEDSQVANEGKSQVAVSDTKVSHKKETHKEGDTYSEANASQISVLIKSFEEINPACKRFYGNKTQRQACADLIANYKFEVVKDAIEKLLPTTNKMTAQFFPNIGTPLELFQKWQKLKDAYHTYQTKNKIKTQNVYW